MVMNSLGFRHAAFGVLAVWAAAPGAAWACATCGCSLSTDAAMGYSAEAGWRINLEYNFIDQDQLRTGTEAISPTQVAPINTGVGAQEVEHQTINRYWNLSVAYSPSADWTVSTIIPYIDRGHTTYGNATPSELTPNNVSTADSNGLGDIKLIVNFQGILPTHNLGLQFGVKLPTGDYGGQNTSTGALVGRDPVLFSSGPNAGSALDTSLNPGTGSTDLIVGSYYYQPISQNFDAFVNGQFQAAVAENLNQPGATYRPGNTASVSFGLRYEANPDWVPQVQINVTHKSADQGTLADTTDTGGTVAYLSPGITVALGKGMLAYSFVQLPIYSRLEGYQLFPRWTASVGVSYAF
jgi:hypothetical protein